MATYILLHDDGASADFHEEPIEAEDDGEAELLARVRLATTPAVERIIVTQRSRQVTVVSRAI